MFWSGFWKADILLVLMLVILMIFSTNGNPWFTHILLEQQSATVFQNLIRRVSILFLKLELFNIYVNIVLFSLLKYYFPYIYLITLTETQGLWHAVYESICTIHHQIFPFSTSYTSYIFGRSSSINQHYSIKPMVFHQCVPGEGLAPFFSPPTPYK